MKHSSSKIVWTKPTITILILSVFLFATLISFSFYHSRLLLFEEVFADVYKVDVEWMGHTTAKVVALTFDDRPDPKFTPEILKILEKYQTPATFFVCGNNVAKYPEILLKEIQAGHEIGNHTFSHPHLLKLTTEQIKTELVLTDEIIKKITRKKTTIFRPPYEELSENIITVTRDLQKYSVLSTITLEHQSLKTPQAEAERVLNLAFPEAIILMHDGRLNRHRTVEALPYLIEGLHAKGYRIVPLKTLLKRK